jgi:hypothetical protein
MNPGIDATLRLAQLGYRFTANGEAIKSRYEGPGDPDPAQVRPLLDVVRQHKEEVRFFLKCHCPRCGGVLFGTINGVSRCLVCYWEEQALLYPDVVRIKH